MSISDHTHKNRRRPTNKRRRPPPHKNREGIRSIWPSWHPHTTKHDAQNHLIQKQPSQTTQNNTHKEHRPKPPTTVKMASIFSTLLSSQETGTHHHKTKQTIPRQGTTKHPTQAECLKYYRIESD